MSVARTPRRGGIPLADVPCKDGHTWTHNYGETLVAGASCDCGEKLWDVIAPEPSLPFDAPEDAPDFDGETYDPEQDHIRLGKQALRVWKCVCDSQWRTFAEIEQEIGATPHPSISSRLRDFRKTKFGAHTVESRLRDPDLKPGLWEYRVVPNPQAKFLF